MSESSASPSDALWQAVIRVPKPSFELFEASFEGALSVSSEPDGEDRFRLTAIYAGKPDKDALETGLAIAAAAAATPIPTLSLSPLETRDWVAEGLKNLDAVAVGRVLVRGAHVPPAAHAGLIELEVDAATAFGTGHHATTAGCLAAIQKVLRRGRYARALDMGCGTGVLAMALARLGVHDVLAADIDPVAVDVTRRNARINRIGRRIRATIAGDYTARPLHAAAPFDLIVANILAQPLIDMAPDLSTALRPGGIAILSGLLARQQNRVLSAHRQCGLCLVSRDQREEWTTLTLTRPHRRTA